LILILILKEALDGVGESLLGFLCGWGNRLAIGE
jgi:hypothetical protein